MKNFYVPPTLSFLILILVFLGSAQMSLAQRSPMLVTMPNLNVRANASATATVVQKLSIGTVITPSERGRQKVVLNEVEDFWYKVTARGKTGWVFGGFLKPFDATQKDEAYQSIVRPRMRAEAKVFEDETDLYGFLTKAIAEAEDRAIKAEFELAQLVILKRSLTLIDLQNMRLYRNWINARKTDIVFSEPSAQYLIKSDLIWALQDKYKDLAFADRIAYEAAITDLPGECEASLTCEIILKNMRQMRYLALYPDGVYTDKILNELDVDAQNILDNLGAYTISKSSLPDLNTAFSELLATLQSLENPKAVETASKFNQIIRRVLK